MRPLGASKISPTSRVTGPSEIKHPGAISVVNYKGGVGKTTISCLLGYYLAELTGQEILLVDIDPQCSLTLAVGFLPSEVSGTRFNIYNLVGEGLWTKRFEDNFAQYVTPLSDHYAPPNLQIVLGSFEVDEMDLNLARSMGSMGQRQQREFFSYCQTVISSFSDYAYVIIDCPPNRMYLTQAMLRASRFFLPVTIPDTLSVYGMPRLLKWISEIDERERPYMLGYVLNGINRTGQRPGRKVMSQERAEANLKEGILSNMREAEGLVFNGEPKIGELPRLDVVARFLGKDKTERINLDSGAPPTAADCMKEIAECITGRVRKFNAQA